MHQKVWMQATQIISVKCSNYQAARKCNHWQIKCESPAHLRRSYSHIFRQLGVICSLPPLEGGRGFKWLVHTQWNKLKTYKHLINTNTQEQQTSHSWSELAARLLFYNNIHNMLSTFHPNMESSRLFHQ